MALREVTMFEIKEVVRLWLRGHGVKTIARSVGADPKTVRRYVRAAERVGMNRDDGVGALDDEHFLAVLEALKTPAPRPDSKGRRLCEQHKSFIEKKLAQRVRRILRVVVEIPGLLKDES